MQLQLAVNNVFSQLVSSLDQLTPEQYTKVCTNLSNSSIGQHVRHIIEMFQCLEKGYDTGVVNYEKRNRDRAIETEKELALELIHGISKRLDRENRELKLEGVYNDTSEELMQFNTNYYREVVYNMEHMIHHMALIRVGLREVDNIEVPASFGVASATVKFNRECAQ
jgi:uncharacterized damage-inducible protein DinB